MVNRRTRAFDPECGDFVYAKMDRHSFRTKAVFVRDFFFVISMTLFRSTVAAERPGLVQGGFENARLNRSAVKKTAVAAKERKEARKLAKKQTRIESTKGRAERLYNNLKSVKTWLFGSGAERAVIRRDLGSKEAFKGFMAFVKDHKKEAKGSFEVESQNRLSGRKGLREKALCCFGQENFKTLTGNLGADHRVPTTFTLPGLNEYNSKRVVEQFNTIVKGCFAPKTLASKARMASKIAKEAAMTPEQRQAAKERSAKRKAHFELKNTLLKVPHLAAEYAKNGENAMFSLWKDEKKARQETYQRRQANVEKIRQKRLALDHYYRDVGALYHFAGQGSREGRREFLERGWERIKSQHDPAIVTFHQARIEARKAERAQVKKIAVPEPQEFEGPFVDGSKGPCNGLEYRPRPAEIVRADDGIAKAIIIAPSIVKIRRPVKHSPKVDEALPPKVAQVVKPGKKEAEVVMPATTEEEELFWGPVEDCKDNQVSFSAEEAFGKDWLESIAAAFKEREEKRNLLKVEVEVPHVEGSNEKIVKTPTKKAVLIKIVNRTCNLCNVNVIGEHDCQQTQEEVEYDYAKMQEDLAKVSKSARRKGDACNGYGCNGREVLHGFCDNCYLVFQKHRYVLSRKEVKVDISTTETVTYKCEECREFVDEDHNCLKETVVVAPPKVGLTSEIKEEVAPVKKVSYSGPVGKKLLERHWRQQAIDQDAIRNVMSKDHSFSVEEAELILSNALQHKSYQSAVNEGHYPEIRKCQYCRCLFSWLQNQQDVTEAKNYACINRRCPMYCGGRRVGLVKPLFDATCRCGHKRDWAQYNCVDCQRKWAKEKRPADLKRTPVLVKAHNNTEPFSGQRCSIKTGATIKWTAGRRSNVIEGFRTLHTREGPVLTGEVLKHGDIKTKKVLPGVLTGQELYVPTSEFRDQKVIVSGHGLWTEEIDGNLFVYKCPTFKYQGTLVSGTPIFNDQDEIVSTVTYSNGSGYYAVMGPSMVPCGIYSVGRYDGHYVEQEFPRPIDSVDSFVRVSSGRLVQINHQCFMVEFFDSNDVSLGSVALQYLYEFGLKGLLFRAHNTVSARGGLTRLAVMLTLITAVMCAATKNQATTKPTTTSTTPIPYLRKLDMDEQDSKMVKFLGAEYTTADLRSIVRDLEANFKGTPVQMAFTVATNDAVTPQSFITEVADSVATDSGFLSNYINKREGAQGDKLVEWYTKFNFYADFCKTAQRNSNAALFIYQRLVWTVPAALKAQQESIVSNCEKITKAGADAQAEISSASGIKQQCKERGQEYEKRLKFLIDRLVILNTPEAKRLLANADVLPSKIADLSLMTNEQIAAEETRLNKAIDSVIALEEWFYKVSVGENPTVPDGIKDLISSISTPPNSVIVDKQPAVKTVVMDATRNKNCWATENNTACVPEKGSVHLDQDANIELKKKLAESMPSVEFDVPARDKREATVDLGSDEVKIFRRILPETNKASAEKVDPGSEEKKSPSNFIDVKAELKKRYTWNMRDLVTIVCALLIAAVGFQEHGPSGALALGFLTLIASSYLPGSEGNCDPDLIILHGTSQTGGDLYDIHGTVYPGSCIKIGDAVMQIEGVYKQHAIGEAGFIVKSVEYKFLSKYGCPFGEESTVCSQKLECPKDYPNERDFCTKSWNGILHKTECAMPGNLWFHSKICMKADTAEFIALKDPKIVIKGKFVHGTDSKSFVAKQGQEITNAGDVNIVSVFGEVTSHYTALVKGFGGVEAGHDAVGDCKVDPAKLTFSKDCLTTSVTQFGPDLKMKIGPSKLEKVKAEGYIHAMEMSDENFNKAQETLISSANIHMVVKQLVTSTARTFCDVSKDVTFSVSHQKGELYKYNEVTFDFATSGCVVRFVTANCDLHGPHLVAVKGKVTITLICAWSNYDTVTVTGNKAVTYNVSGLQVEWNRGVHKLYDTVAYYTTDSQMAKKVGEALKSIPLLGNMFSGKWLKAIKMTCVVLAVFVAVIIGGAVASNVNGGLGGGIIVAAIAIGFIEMANAQTCVMWRADSEGTQIPKLLALNNVQNRIHGVWNLPIRDQIPCDRARACETFTANRVDKFLSYSPATWDSPCGTTVAEYCKHGAHAGYQPEEYLQLVNITCRQAFNHWHQCRYVKSEGCNVLQQVATAPVVQIGCKGDKECGNNETSASQRITPGVAPVAMAVSLIVAGSSLGKPYMPYFFVLALLIVVQFTYKVMLFVRTLGRRCRAILDYFRSSYGVVATVCDIVIDVSIVTLMWSICGPWAIVVVIVGRNPGLIGVLILANNHGLVVEDFRGHWWLSCVIAHIWPKKRTNVEMSTIRNRSTNIAAPEEEQCLSSVTEIEVQANGKANDRELLVSLSDGLFRNIYNVEMKDRTTGKRICYAHVIAGYMIMPAHAVQNRKGWRVKYDIAVLNCRDEGLFDKIIAEFVSEVGPQVVKLEKEGEVCHEVAFKGNKAVRLDRDWRAGDSGLICFMNDDKLWMHKGVFPGTNCGVNCKNYIRVRFHSGCSNESGDKEIQRRGRSMTPKSKRGVEGGKTRARSVSQSRSLRHEQLAIEPAKEQVVQERQSLMARRLANYRAGQTVKLLAMADEKMASKVSSLRITETTAKFGDKESRLIHHAGGTTSAEILEKKGYKIEAPKVITKPESSRSKTPIGVIRRQNFIKEVKQDVYPRGVLKIFEEHNIQPVVVAGTSDPKLKGKVEQATLVAGLEHTLESVKPEIRRQVQNKIGKWIENNKPEAKITKSNDIKALGEALTLVQMDRLERAKAAKTLNEKGVVVQKQMPLDRVRKFWDFEEHALNKSGKITEFADKEDGCYQTADEHHWVVCIDGQAATCGHCVEIDDLTRTRRHDLVATDKEIIDKCIRASEIEGDCEGELVSVIDGELVKNDGTPWQVGDSGMSLILEIDGEKKFVMHWGVNEKGKSVSPLDRFLVGEGKYRCDPVDCFEAIQVIDDQKIMLTQCIALDCKMSAGFAKRSLEVSDDKDLREKIEAIVQERQIEVGEFFTVPTFINGKPVNYVLLVTKPNSFKRNGHILENLKMALKNLGEFCLCKQSERIFVMPKIGCGLDRLDWESVEPLIKGEIMERGQDVWVCAMNEADATTELLEEVDVEEAGSDGSEEISLDEDQESITSEESLEEVIPADKVDDFEIFLKNIPEHEKAEEIWDGFIDGFQNEIQLVYPKKKLHDPFFTSFIGMLFSSKFVDQEKLLDWSAVHNQFIHKWLVQVITSGGALFCRYLHPDEKDERGKIIKKNRCGSYLTSIGVRGSCIQRTCYLQNWLMVLRERPKEVKIHLMWFLEPGYCIKHNGQEFCWEKELDEQLKLTLAEFAEPLFFDNIWWRKTKVEPKIEKQLESQSGVLLIHPEHKAVLSLIRSSIRTQSDRRLELDYVCYPSRKGQETIDRVASWVNNSNGIYFLHFNGVSSGWAFIHGSVGYSSYHVTRGNTIVVSTLSNIHGTALVPLGHAEQTETHVTLLCTEKLQTFAGDMAVYGTSTKNSTFDKVDVGGIYGLFNPMTKQYTTLLARQQEGKDGQLSHVFSFVDVSREEGIVPCALASGLKGWSGLPIVDLKTGNPVAIYGFLQRRRVQIDSKMTEAHWVCSAVPSTRGLKFNIGEHSKEILRVYKGLERKIAGHEKWLRITAPTSAGKSTKLVLDVTLKRAAELGTSVKAIICEPTIITVDGLSEYMKVLTSRDSTYSKSVAITKRHGRINRLETESNDTSRAKVQLQYCTYGSGINEDFSKIDMIFLDEIHSRYNADVVALERLLWAMGKKNVVTMSATLWKTLDNRFEDLELKGETMKYPIKNGFLRVIRATEKVPDDCYIISEESRVGNVEYTLFPREELADNCRILVFLSEINSCIEHVNAWHSKGYGIPAHALYSESAGNQIPEGTCVIYCTDVVESGITITNCQHVVDFRRTNKPEASFELIDKTTGQFSYTYNIQRRMIDHCAATQRKGRTGRQMPGGYWIKENDKEVLCEMEDMPQATIIEAAFILSQMDNHMSFIQRRECQKEYIFRLATFLQPGSIADILNLRPYRDINIRGPSAMRVSIERAAAILRTKAGLVRCIKGMQPVEFYLLPVYPDVIKHEKYWLELFKGRERDPEKQRLAQEYVSENLIPSREWVDWLRETNITIATPFVNAVIQFAMHDEDEGLNKLFGTVPKKKVTVDLSRNVTELVEEDQHNSWLDISGIAVMGGSTAVTVGVTGFIFKQFCDYYNGERFASEIYVMTKNDFEIHMGAFEYLNAKKIAMTRDPRYIKFAKDIMKGCVSGLSYAASMLPGNNTVRAALEDFINNDLHSDGIPEIIHHCIEWLKNLWEMVVQNPRDYLERLSAYLGAPAVIVCYDWIRNELGGPLGWLCVAGTCYYTATMLGLYGGSVLVASSFWVYLGMHVMGLSRKESDSIIRATGEYSRGVKREKGRYLELLTAITAGTWIEQITEILMKLIRSPVMKVATNTVMTQATSAAATTVVSCAAAGAGKTMLGKFVSYYKYTSSLSSGFDFTLKLIELFENEGGTFSENWLMNSFTLLTGAKAIAWDLDLNAITASVVTAGIYGMYSLATINLDESWYRQYANFKPSAGLEACLVKGSQEEKERRQKQIKHTYNSVVALAATGLNPINIVPTVFYMFMKRSECIENNQEMKWVEEYKSAITCHPLGLTVQVVLTFWNRLKERKGFDKVLSESVTHADSVVADLVNTVEAATDPTKTAEEIKSWYSSIKDSISETIELIRGKCTTENIIWMGDFVRALFRQLYRLVKWIWNKTVGCLLKKIANIGKGMVDGVIDCILDRILPTWIRNKFRMYKSKKGTPPDGELDELNLSYDEFVYNYGLYELIKKLPEGVRVRAFTQVACPWPNQDYMDLKAWSLLTETSMAADLPALSRLIQVANPYIKDYVIHDSDRPHLHLRYIMRAIAGHFISDIEKQMGGVKSMTDQEGFLKSGYSYKVIHDQGDTIVLYFNKYASHGCIIAATTTRSYMISWGLPFEEGLSMGKQKQRFELENPRVSRIEAEIKELKESPKRPHLSYVKPVMSKTLCWDQILKVIARLPISAYTKGGEDFKRIKAVIQCVLSPTYLDYLISKSKNQVEAVEAVLSNLDLDSDIFLSGMDNSYAPRSLEQILPVSTETVREEFAVADSCSIFDPICFSNYKGLSLLMARIQPTDLMRSDLAIWGHLVFGMPCLVPKENDTYFKCDWMKPFNVRGQFIVIRDHKVNLVNFGLGGDHIPLISPMFNFAFKAKGNKARRAMIKKILLDEPFDQLEGLLKKPYFSELIKDSAYIPGGSPSLAKKAPIHVDNLWLQPGASKEQEVCSKCEEEYTFIITYRNCNDHFSIPVRVCDDCASVLKREKFITGEEFEGERMSYWNIERTLVSPSPVTADYVKLHRDDSLGFCEDIYIPLELFTVAPIDVGNYDYEIKVDHRSLVDYDKLKYFLAAKDNYREAKYLVVNVERKQWWGLHELGGEILFGLNGKLWPYIILPTSIVKIKSKMLYCDVKTKSPFELAFVHHYTGEELNQEQLMIQEEYWQQILEGSLHKEIDPSLDQLMEEIYNKGLGELRTLRSKSEEFLGLNEKEIRRKIVATEFKADDFWIRDLEKKLVKPKEIRALNLNESQIHAEGSPLLLDLALEQGAVVPTDEQIRRDMRAVKKDEKYVNVLKRKVKERKTADKTGVLNRIKKGFILAKDVSSAVKGVTSTSELHGDSFVQTVTGMVDRIKDSLPGLIVRSFLPMDPVSERENIKAKPSDSEVFDYVKRTDIPLLDHIANPNAAIIESIERELQIKAIVNLQRIDHEEDCYLGSNEQTWIVNISNVERRSLPCSYASQNGTSMKTTYEYLQPKEIKLQARLDIRKSEIPPQGMPIEPIYRTKRVRSVVQLDKNAISNALKSIDHITGPIWEAMAGYNRLYKPGNVEVKTASRGWEKALAMDCDLNIFADSECCFDMTCGYGGFSQYYTHSPQLLKLVEGKVVWKDGRKKNLFYNTLRLPNHALPLADSIIHRERYEKGERLVHAMTPEGNGDIRDKRTLELALQAVDQHGYYPDLMIFDAGESSNNLVEESAWQLKLIPMDEELEANSFAQTFSDAAVEYMKLIRPGGRCIMKMMGYTDHTVTIMRKYCRLFDGFICYKNPTTSLISREWYLILIGRNHKRDTMETYCVQSRGERVYKIRNGKETEADFDYDQIVNAMAVEFYKGVVQFTQWARMNFTQAKQDLNAYPEQKSLFGMGAIIDENRKQIPQKEYVDILTRGRDKWPNLTLDNLLKKYGYKRRWIVPRYHQPIVTPGMEWLIPKPRALQWMNDDAMYRRSIGEKEVSTVSFTRFGLTFKSDIPSRVGQVKQKTIERGFKIMGSSGTFTYVKEACRIRFQNRMSKEKFNANNIHHSMVYYVFGQTRESSTVGHTQATAEKIYESYKTRLDLKQQEPSEADAELLRLGMLAARTPECVKIWEGRDKDKFKPFIFEQACELIHKQGAGGHFDQYKDFGAAIADPAFKEEVMHLYNTYKKGGTSGTYQVCRIKKETKIKKNVDNGRLKLIAGSKKGDQLEEYDPRSNYYKRASVEERKKLDVRRKEKLLQASSIKPRFIRYANFAQRMVDLMILGPVQQYHANVTKLYLGSTPGIPLWKLGNLTKCIHDVYCTKPKQEFWEASQEEDWFNTIMSGKSPLGSAYIKMYDQNWRGKIEKKMVECLLASGDFSGWDGTVSKTDLIINYLFYENLMQKEFHLLLKTRFEHWLWAIVITDEGNLLICDGQRSSGDQDTSFGNTMLNVIYHVVATALSLGLNIQESTRIIGEVWYHVDFNYEKPKWKKHYLTRISHIADGDDNVHFGTKEDMKLFCVNGPLFLERCGKKIRCGDSVGYTVSENYDELSYCSHSYRRTRIGSIDGIPIDMQPKSARPRAGKNIGLGTSTTNLGEQNKLDRDAGLRVVYLPYRPLAEIIGKLTLTMKTITNNISLDRDYGPTRREQKRAEVNEFAITVMRGKLLSYMLNYAHISSVRQLCMSALALIGDGTVDFQQMKKRYHVPSVMKSIIGGIKSVFGVDSLHMIETLAPSIERQNLQVMRDNTFLAHGTLYFKEIGAVGPTNLQSLHVRLRQWLEWYSYRNDCLVDWSYWETSKPGVSIGEVLETESKWEPPGKKRFDKKDTVKYQSLLSKILNMFTILSVVTNEGARASEEKETLTAEQLAVSDLIIESDTEGLMTKPLRKIVPDLPQVIKKYCHKMGGAEAAIGTVMKYSGEQNIYVCISRSKPWHAPEPTMGINLVRTLSEKISRDKIKKDLIAVLKNGRLAKNSFEHLKWNASIRQVRECKVVS